MLLGACSSKICFNDNWSFSLSDNPKASETDFDDKDWRVLNLPHDWAIEGDFSKDNPSGTGGGALPGGTGWYRKTFVPGNEDSDKIIRIDFDGIYMNSEVFINGQSLGKRPGKRPYGYISFGYDITPYLKWNEKNVIAVRVDNSEQPNSRWYSGCGIYRNVWLTKTNPVHVDEWGTYVTTSEISNNNCCCRDGIICFCCCRTEIRCQPHSDYLITYIMGYRKSVFVLPRHRDYQRR